FLTFFRHRPSPSRKALQYAADRWTVTRFHPAAWPIHAARHLQSKPRAVRLQHDAPCRTALHPGKRGVQVLQLLCLCTITPYPTEQQSYIKMIRITPSLWLDESELEETFVRASGPGGQHVNKTSSAVQLRFDARQSRSLAPDVAERLIQLAGNRATQDGVIVLTAQRHRSQPLNRADALERLVELIRRATIRETI